MDSISSSVYSEPTAAENELVVVPESGTMVELDERQLEHLLNRVEELQSQLNMARSSPVTGGAVVARYVAETAGVISRPAWLAFVQLMILTRPEHHMDLSSLAYLGSSLPVTSRLTQAEILYVNMKIGDTFGSAGTTVDVADWSTMQMVYNMPSNYKVPSQYTVPIEGLAVGTRRGQTLGGVVTAWRNPVSQNWACLDPQGCISSGLMATVPPQHPGQWIQGPATLQPHRQF